MKCIYTIFISYLMFSSSLLYNFSEISVLSDWKIVDDVVMGGKSDGNFSISPEGSGIYNGTVSAENNGGFSSLRHQMKPTNISGAKHFILKIKGDGKDYQFRVKDKISNYYSYKTEFSTTGEWEEIKLKIKDFHPTFRDRTLDKPNFSGEILEEMTFLISNKKNESFRLEIDEIIAE